jgi:prepilin-type N-terminal cleavage/methylation domain-containing protein
MISSLPPWAFSMLVPSLPLRGFSHQRRGFTLVELLTTIAIIGLLIALLLPAIQSARESARRMTCANKLGQIAKACLLYANSNGTYPAAFTSRAFSSVPMAAFAGSCGGATIPTFSNDQSPAWSVVILPFLEQQSRFDSFVPHQSGGAFDGAYNRWTGTNRTAAYTPNSAYQCPSDPVSDSSETNTNYFGVSGGFSGTTGNWLSPAPAGKMPKDGYIWFAANGAAHFNSGIIHINGRVTEGAILDGLSNTFLIGETRYQWTLRSEEAIEAFEPRTAVGMVSRPSWAGGARNWGCRADGLMNLIVSTHASTSRTSINGSGCTDMLKAPPLRDGASNCRQPYQNMQGDFGSFHPGGCHFALADGAVKFVDEMIDINLYRRLGVRADGQLMSGLPW